MYGMTAAKPSPWGEGGAPARRMRGECPKDSPSSVTCGDSFPQRGKPLRKAFPLGGRWRGTRRMRGKCPVDSPSSVTCGDSFPQKGGSLLGGLPVTPAGYSRNPRSYFSPNPHTRRRLPPTRCTRYPLYRGSAQRGFQCLCRSRCRSDSSPLRSSPALW